jgi:hypothetical protein
MNNRVDVRISSVLFLFPVVLGLAASPGILGCNSDIPFDFVPVHGKLTYEDGSLIEADSILVTFNPIRSDEKAKMVAPGGQTNVNIQDGTFAAVSSHRANDGLAIGRHKVVVVSFKNVPGGMPAPSAAVPPIYRNESSTPLEVQVDSSTEFLELKVRKK